MAARRAERDLREEREKALRLERELEGWKGLRMERGVKNSGISNWVAAANGTHHVNGGSVRAAAAAVGGNKVRNGSGSGGGMNGVVGNRRMSDSKGFL